MAKKSKALISLEYAAVRVLFFCISIWPRKISVAIGLAFGRACFRLFGSLRKTALQNLEIAFPEKTPEERSILARETFENLGRVLGEAVHFQDITKEEIIKFVDFEFDVEIKALYQKVKQDGRGVVIITGHMGNWELLVLAFAALYEPISFLARPIDNPLIEDFLQRSRLRFGNRAINKTNSIMTAVSHVSGGGMLGVLADVNAHPKEGVFVPFFDVPACTPAGAAMIALRSNALIVPAFCVWDRDIQKFKLVLGELMEPANTGDRKADVQTTTAAFTLQIEKIIRQYPGQWMWIHKRWKTRPPGDPGLY